MTTLKRSRNTLQRNTFSALLLAWQVLFSCLAIYLSLSEHALVWFVGQLLLAINFLQWFFLEHDLGHDNFLSSKKLSYAFGCLSSVFTLIPFPSWRKVHHAHHKWTGWREKDPTIPDATFESLSKSTIKTMNFCWKYWIPVFAISFTAQTFWNLKRLNRLFPDNKSKQNHLFGVVFLALVYLVAVGSLGGLFFKIWLLAFFLFIFFSDPYLLSQHTHIDYKELDKEALKPVPYLHQDLFSRSVVYPSWVEKYILYNTNKHGLHHQYPWLAVYELSLHPNPKENTIHWLEWLKLAKSMPAQELIFHSTKHTGVKL